MGSTKKTKEKYENVDNYIKVLEAHKNGQAIEVRPKGELGEWHDLDRTHDGQGNDDTDFNFGCNYYRVKAASPEAREYGGAGFAALCAAGLPAGVTAAGIEAECENFKLTRENIDMYSGMTKKLNEIGMRVWNMAKQRQVLGEPLIRGEYNGFATSRIGMTLKTIAGDGTHALMVPWNVVVAGEYEEFVDDLWHKKLAAVNEALANTNPDDSAGVEWIKSVVKKLQDKYGV